MNREEKAAAISELGEGIGKATNAFVIAFKGITVPQVTELRRQVPALDRRAFDDYVLTLHREGVIHLLSHVEPDKLSADIREQCVVHASGALLYWLRWL